MLKLIETQHFNDGQIKAILRGTAMADNPLRGDSVAYEIWMPFDPKSTMASIEAEAIRRAKALSDANPF